MKICKKCNIEKSFDEFHKYLKSKDGFKSTCKDCRKLESNVYYEENRETLINKVSEYRKNNKGYIETNREYRENNKEFVIQLKYDWSNSESGKISRKKYYENNKSVILSKQKINRDENIDSFLLKEKEKRKTSKYKKYKNEYDKNHRKEKPWLYICRTILRNTLKSFNKSKECKTIELLGYSPLELKHHIESLFFDDMSWDNYGKWHIDHIKMVSTFSKDTPSNIINALSNLRPLWAYDNLSRRFNTKE